MIERGQLDQHTDRQRHLCNGNHRWYEERKPPSTKSTKHLSVLGLDNTIMYRDDPKVDNIGSDNTTNKGE
ncbi:DUF3060 domain-containing protein [Mycobacterium leprae]|uniref:DUF3060 domain-containing protein n=1 Tax=Mycobacterium leprae TaxID=1769 RepID=UPI003F661007